MSFVYICGIEFESSGFNPIDNNVDIVLQSHPIQMALDRFVGQDVICIMVKGVEIFQ